MLSVEKKQKTKIKSKMDSKTHRLCLVPEKCKRKKIGRKEKAK